MRWFLGRYREGSSLSRIAFWTVLTSALLALATVPLQRRDDFNRFGDWLYDGLTIVMFVGLVVQGLSVQRDKWRRQRGNG